MPLRIPVLLLISRSENFESLHSVSVCAATLPFSYTLHWNSA